MSTRPFAESRNGAFSSRKSTKITPAPVFPPRRRKLARKSAVDATSFANNVLGMRGEFTAIIEEAPEGGYWAICPEVSGANGQGETIEEAKSSLRDAIRLIMEDRIDDMRRGLPSEAIQTMVTV